MESNEILVDRVYDISLRDFSELKVSNDSKHEVDQNQKCSDVDQWWNRKLNRLKDSLKTFILSCKF